MPVSSNNKFSRARRHLRSTQIDEKLQLLNEIPTNNTTSYYVIEPDVVTVIPPVRADFDLEADDPALQGKDTSGLFDGNGAVLTQQPPGDTTYILGPMVSVFFPDGDYSAIGYVQKDTRKVINLARIPGRVRDWALDGTTEGFTSYSQLTLEQALWYRDQLIAGDTTPYRVFYIGVFEQIQSEPGVTDPSTGIDIDEYGRWLGDLINLGYEIEPGRTEVTPGKKGPDPDMPPGIANPALQKLRDKFKRGENLTIDDFPSAADFSAFKNGGGNAALRQGKTIGEVIRQGIININGYDSGARLADYDDYMGPAFGNDSVANRERQKAVDARNDAIYDYWRNNYVNPDTSVNPGGLTQKQIDDMPDWYRDISTPPDPNNYAGAFKDTPVGQAVNDFMNDPTHGWWRQSALELGVGVLGQLAGRRAPVKKPVRKPTIGATGMDRPGYQAVTGGQGYRVPQGGGILGKGSQPVLGRGAYSAPQVGQVGPGGLRPGSGGSRYAKPGGGVVGTVVPPGARGTNIIEPQKVVPGKTFDKGRDLASRVAGGQYPKSPRAGQIRQDMIDAGFPKGKSTIPYDQLPQKPPMKPGGQSFSNFAKTAVGAAGALGAAELLAPAPAEPNVSKNELNKRITDRLPGYTIGEFDQQGKGDHVTAPILDPQGRPVINPRTGKPVTIGGGVRGKNQLSNSALGTLTNAINQIKSGGADTTGQAQGSKKIDTTTKKPVTRTGRRVQPVQPKPTTRSTIKTMPASMMGKTAPKPQSPSMGPVVDPANTNPYNQYGYTPGGLRPPGVSSRARSAMGKFGSGKFLKFSNDLEGSMLTENRNRILRDVKKSYQLPEAKKEKVKHRPKVIKPTEDKTRVVGDGLMKQAEVPTSFKRLEDRLWKKYERQQNTRLSQERKNMILDTVGTSDHAWEWMTDRSKKKNEKSVYENFGQGVSNQIVSKKKVGNDYIIKMYNEEGKLETITQSILNERLQKQYELEAQLKEQETIYAPKDPLVKRVKNKLYSQIDYPNKPAKLGYPDEPPKQMIGGYHPDFGDRHSYYNRLDRHSADTMQNAPTQDLEIDRKVQNQTTRQKALNVISNVRAARAQYSKATRKNK